MSTKSSQSFYSRAEHTGCKVFTLWLHRIVPFLPFVLLLFLTIAHVACLPWSGILVTVVFCLCNVRDTSSIHISLIPLSEEGSCCVCVCVMRHNITEDRPKKITSYSPWSCPFNWLIIIMMIWAVSLKAPLLYVFHTLNTHLRMNVKGPCVKLINKHINKKYNYKDATTTWVNHRQLLKGWELPRLRLGN